MTQSAGALLEKRHDDLSGGVEFWFVRPDHIDDVLRVNIKPNGGLIGDAQASLIVATDADFSSGTLRSLVESAALDLGMP
ncbi:hypothetical protein ACLQ3D_10295 [Micromonospora vinacea]|uniref:hypothetical protein n=1 Tax=Micromonospora TaxID=1873 RepID=UPI002ED35A50|nr:hypothetical protein OHB44_23130 [Micromonospora sp. NBC_00821]